MRPFFWSKSGKTSVQIFALGTPECRPAEINHRKNNNNRKRMLPTEKAEGRENMDPRMRLSYEALLRIMDMPQMKWAACEYQCPACAKVVFTLNGVHDPSAPDIDVMHVGMPGEAVSECLGKLAGHFIDSRKCLDVLEKRAKRKRRQQPPGWYAPPPFSEN